MSKKHIEYIDTAKVIGLYLMILGHGCVNESITQWIYSFHMPLFFFISGMLHKDKPVLDTIKKDYKSLIIPYLFINALCLIIFWSAKIYHNTISIDMIINNFKAIALGVGYNINGYKPVAGSMWFVYVLFLIHITINICHKNVFKIFLFITSIIIVSMLEIFNIDIYIPLDSAFAAIPYFIGGIYLKLWLSKLVNYKKICFLMCIISLISVVLINSINGRVDINNMWLGNSIILFYICGFLGLFAVITMSIIAPPRHIAKRFYEFNKIISQGSLLIVGFNLYFTGWLKSILLLLGLYGNTILGLLGGLLILFAFYLIIPIVSRKFPAIIGYR